MQSAKELFGSARGATALALDTFEPKSLKDHEELARQVAQQYLLPHSKNQHYKTLLKALLKQACGPVALPEVKDLETCIAGIKSDKIKEDKAAKEAKKGAVSSLAHLILCNPCAICAGLQASLHVHSTMFRSILSGMCYDLWT